MSGLKHWVKICTAHLIAPYVVFKDENILWSLAKNNCSLSIRNAEEKVSLPDFIDIERNSVWLSSQGPAPLTTAAVTCIKLGQHDSLKWKSKYWVETIERERHWSRGIGWGCPRKYHEIMSQEKIPRQCVLILF